MSETEEPPAKLLKTDNEDEAASTDATELSNLTEASEIPENTDLPESIEPTMPQVTDTQESLEMAEGISMESTEMVEERLHDSLESQDAPESQESQEEWLSEGVLTDDDFNPAAESAPESQTSQPENSQFEAESPVTNNTAEPEQKEQETTDPIPMEAEAKAPEQNIEDALNTLEGGPENDSELPELDELLIKKTNEKTEVVQSKPEKPESDDGNDTDDLLRMLGEDGSKTKKMTKTVKDVRSTVKEPASSDDDDNVLQGASAKKLKLAKSFAKKLAPKAEPEEMDGDGTDPSSDEAATIKKIFTTKKSNQKSTKRDVKAVRYQETHAKSIVNIVERPRKDRIASSTPLRPARERSLLRAPRASAPAARASAPAPRASAPAPRAPDLSTVQLKREPQHHSYSRKKPQNVSKAATAPKATSILKTAVKVEPKEPEVTHEEEFLDDDFQLDEEEFESDFEDDKDRQRIMKPEQMDEDLLSDAESHSEDGSLYDELPSSESEDADDWFQLDIRAEKAGDYLPLLGAKAKELLLEEKKRVAARLSNLKQSLSALTDSGKKQADQVRTATMSLAELDDMLKAS